jgi:hypothetical protein
MSYRLGSVDPDERAGGFGASPGGGIRPVMRVLLSSALVLLVMAAFAGGVWFAHVSGGRRGGDGSGDIPLLRADPHPFKVKPAAPGGMVIPDQNMLVYGERHDTVEHLLPPPEAPMPRPAPPPPPASPRAAPAPQAPVAAPAAVPATAPPPAAPEHAAASPPPAPAAAMPAAAAKPAAATAQGGGVRLQLGAVRSPQEARREWQRLKHDNADLLGDVAGFAVRADLGAKGIYYRIETAPFADPAAAARVCAALKRRGSGCILER